MKRSLSLALTLFLAICGSAHSLHAQDIAGITGVVTDTNGDVIVGADVSLVNTTTRASYSSRTNVLGAYTIADVTPGPGYKLTFKRPGFAAVVVNDIYLTVATTRTQNAVMKPGSVSAEVHVSAANSEVTLDTTDATVGNSLDVSLLNDLPVQLRDTPSSLFTLQPGITTIAAVPALKQQSVSSVTGTRTDQSYVSVDGLDVNDISNGQTFVMVANAPVDSVEEFHGTVAGDTADSGPGGGGKFELVTRSGTNAWHGNVNEYHRDTSTTANDWFNNELGVSQPHLVRNQFGGNIGGPIRKNKAFIFFNFFDLRLARGSSIDTVVPTQSYVSGNVSYINNSIDPATSQPCAASSRLNRNPTCISTIGQAQEQALDPQGTGFSSVLLGFLGSRYSHLTGGAYDPSYGDGVNTEGYRFNAPDPQDETNYVARFDYMISPTMRFFAKAGINREDSIEWLQVLPTDPAAANPNQNRSYDYMLGHTWAIGTTKVNQFSYGDTIEKLNFPATYAPGGTTVLTLGGSFLGNPYPVQQSQKRRIPIPVVRDDFKWQSGAHSLSFGGSFKFIKTENRQTNDFNFLTVGLGPDLPALSPAQRPADFYNGPDQRPAFFYDSAFATGLGHISDVTSNYNYSASGAVYPNGTGHVTQYRYYETELYAMDTWRAMKNLTLTYGLRYQYNSVPYETNGLESVENLDFNTYFKDRVQQSAAGQSGASTVPLLTYNLGGKANNAAPMFQPNVKDFAPRVSFAYNPGWASKTVLRGGAGIVYDRTVYNAMNFLQDQSSWIFQNTAETSYGDLASDPRVGANFSFPGNTAPTITKPYQPNVSGGFPYGLAYSPYTFDTVIDPHLKDPYSIALNAGIQQQLPWSMVLKVDYVGRLGRRLLAQADASQLIDFPDSSSGQMLSAAFGNMTQEIRAGQPAATPQPWIEDQIGPGWTNFLYNALSNYVYYGDFGDFVQQLAAHGLIDYNVGMAAQFSENSFYTNKGSSSYNGLLVTLNKNTTHGLRFDVNYTYAHSIDNTSLAAAKVASGIGVASGFICDVLRPRECRGNSDFDQTHVINGDFLYELPVGRGKALLGTAPRWVDAVAGGWAISGIPQWHSGLAFTAFSNAYVAGFANDAPGIFNGNRAAVKAHLHKLPDGSVNLFSSPTAADAAFTGPVGFTIGSRNNLRGLSAWTFDAGAAKSFAVAEGVNVKFRADAFNALNHPTFALPTGNDITTESTGIAFGQITATTGTPRVLQLALRVEF